MVVEVLAPGVQHGEEPDLGSEVSGVGGDLQPRPLAHREGEERSRFWSRSSGLVGA